MYTPAVSLHCSAAQGGTAQARSPESHIPIRSTRRQTAGRTGGTLRLGSRAGRGRSLLLLHQSSSSSSSSSSSTQTMISSSSSSSSRPTSTATTRIITIDEPAVSWSPPPLRSCCYTCRRYASTAVTRIQGLGHCCDGTNPPKPWNPTNSSTKVGCGSVMTVLRRHVWLKRFRFAVPLWQSYGWLSAAVVCMKKGAPGPLKN
jgi:hypothetical protein